MAFVTFGPQNVVLTGSGQWLCPPGVSAVFVQCWGAGGGGCVSGSLAGGGGGGGAYAANQAVAVTAGKLYAYVAGAGGAGGLLAGSAGTFAGAAGGSTLFPGDSVTVTANGGAGATSQAGAAGGTAGSAAIAYAGGAGGNGVSGSFVEGSGGGGGGSSAGVASAGAAGQAATTGDAPGGSGGAAPSGGGSGGNGGTYGSARVADGQPGQSPGGGGGGCCGTGPGHGTYGGNGANGQILLTYVLPPSWTCPAGVFSVLAECTGGGGGGGDRSGAGAGAGGGGEYAAQVVTVTPGNVYAVTVGPGGAGATTTGTSGSAGGTTSFPGSSTVTAHGGSGGGSSGTGGTGGTGSSASVHYNGGAGGSGASGGGGGGGGSAAAGSAGNAGGNATTSVPGAGAAALTGGGPGASGGAASQPGGLSPQTGPGGGGGGGDGHPGGAGYAGRVTLTWAVASLECTSSLIAGQFAAPQVVNQWAATTAHNPVFGPSLPLNASTVVPLDPSASVGDGSGYPSPGNWLFAVAGWHADPDFPVTVAAADDVHSYWRPQAPSDPSGGSRATAWFTPNLIAAPQVVTVAPSGYAPGFSVLVVEVAGLGDWDETTAVTGYAGTALSLDLYCPAGVTALEYSAGVLSPALHPVDDSGSPAVPQVTFFLAAVCGDSAAAGTVFAPYGWEPLAGVTCSNASDASSDAVLEAACVVSSAGQSVTATATAAENLSGVIIAVVIDAPSPVPAVRNPNWPYVIAEAAFGAGMQTPPDQMTWVNLQSPQGGHRVQSWDETTGIQYELGTIEASEVTLALDNPDGWLSPSTPGSPWYPRITPGTPVRLRTVPPGGTRWHVIQRNMERWPQAWSKIFRGTSNATATDIWSVANRFVPSCYRAEVLADEPGWWYPCDDSGVNQATSLVNAAPASSLPLTIAVSPCGLTSYGPYDGIVAATYAYVAIQQFAQQSGWMYGDTLSAAWQQSGTGVSSTGRYLSANDAFPPLSGGVTIETWWQPSLASAGYSIPPAIPEAPVPQGYNAQPCAPNAPGSIISGPTGTPVSPLVIWEIASDTGPLAMLSLDAHSQLTFTTWSSGVPSATVIYSLYKAQYLWDGAWTGITVTMTQTGWTVYVNGGVVATVSGTAAMADAWSWFLAGAGTGNAGGPPVASTITGIPNAAWSHIAIYPRVLPPARVMAHFMAAYTAFGQLPAPSVTCQFTANAAGGPDYMPDGNAYLQIQFFNASGAGGGPNGDRSVLAAYVTATAGEYTSAVSQPESVNLFTLDIGAVGQAWLAASGLAPQYSYWVGNTGGGEQLYSHPTVQPYMYVTAYGTGASPPAEASALGDSVANRIERLLQAGGVTTPQRCIGPAGLAVVAELDTAGQSAGDNITNIVASDDGLLYVDTCGNLCYQTRQQLAAQSPAWQLGPFTGSGQIPYQGDVTFDTDPQRVYNDVAVTQYDVTAVPAGQAGFASGSAETSGGLVFGPAAAYAAAVQQSLDQYGDCQLQFTSYLQDSAQIQAQASWLFAVYGTPRQRVTSLTVDAAAMARTCPQAWEFVLAVNPGDVVQVTQWMPGQTAFTAIFRVTQVKRKLGFSGGTASATVLADWCPPWWWGTGQPQEIDDQAGAPLTDQSGQPMY